MEIANRDIAKLKKIKEKAEAWRRADENYNTFCMNVIQSYEDWPTREELQLKLSIATDELIEALDEANE